VLGHGQNLSRWVTILTIVRGGRCRFHRCLFAAAEEPTPEAGRLSMVRR
jgi:hypothetical protein